MAQTRDVDSAWLVHSLVERKTVGGIRVRTSPDFGPSELEARLFASIRIVKIPEHD